MNEALRKLVDGMLAVAYEIREKRVTVEELHRQYNESDDILHPHNFAAVDQLFRLLQDEYR